MLEDIRGEGWRCLSLHMRKARLTYTKAWVAWMTVHLYQYAEHHLNAVLAAFATRVHNNPQRVLELGVLLDATPAQRATAGGGAATGVQYCARPSRLGTAGACNANFGISQLPPSSGSPARGLSGPLEGPLTGVPGHRALFRRGRIGANLEAAYRRLRQVRIGGLTSQYRSCRTPK